MIRASAQKVRVTGQESELQPGRLPESETNCPEKEPEWGLSASMEDPPNHLSPNNTGHLPHTGCLGGTEFVHFVCLVVVSRTLFRK